jgi:hypothetical protein
MKYDPVAPPQQEDYMTFVHGNLTDFVNETFNLQNTSSFVDHRHTPVLDEPSFLPPNRSNRWSMQRWRANQHYILGSRVRLRSHLADREIRASEVHENLGIVADLFPYEHNRLHTDRMNTLINLDGSADFTVRDQIDGFVSTAHGHLQVMSQIRKEAIRSVDPPGFSEKERLETISNQSKDSAARADALTKETLSAAGIDPTVFYSKVATETLPELNKGLLTDEFDATTLFGVVDQSQITSEEAELVHKLKYSVLKVDLSQVAMCLRYHILDTGAQVNVRSQPIPRRFVTNTQCGNVNGVGGKIPIDQKGNIPMYAPGEEHDYTFLLKDVIYSKEFKTDLLSWGCLQEDGWSLKLYEKDKQHLSHAIDPDGGKHMVKIKNRHVFILFGEESAAL